MNSSVTGTGLAEFINYVPQFLGQSLGRAADSQETKRTQTLERNAQLQHLTSPLPLSQTNQLFELELQLSDTEGRAGHSTAVDKRYLWRP